MSKLFTALLALLVVPATLAGGSGHLVQIPEFHADGGNKEVIVLSVSDTLKVATVTLRGGTTLPTHSTPVPATVLVVKGHGTVNVDGTAFEVGVGSLVLLEAGAPHDVVPADGTDMQLLVHYLLGEGEHPESSHAHEHAHEH